MFTSYFVVKRNRLATYCRSSLPAAQSAIVELLSNFLLALRRSIVVGFFSKHRPFQDYRHLCHSRGWRFFLVSPRTFARIGVLFKQDNALSCAGNPYAELEWLLDGDRWKTVGGGFSDINEFLGTLNFADFRITAERRKKIAGRLAAIEASQRATARMLGVGVGTVSRDLDVPNGTPKAEKPNKIRAEDVPNVPNGTPSAGASASENSPPPAPSGDAPAAPVGLLQSPAATFKTAKKAAAQADAATRREERIEAISAKSTALPEAVRYPIILADPPWRYENPPMGWDH